MSGENIKQRPFQTGGWRVDPAPCTITRGGGDVHLEPRVMDVLVALAARRGEVVSKDDLVREVWQGRFTTDEVVTVAVFQLRRALGDSARQPQFVETVPRRGYRWLPAVELENEAQRAAVEYAGPPARRRLAGAAIVVAGLAAVAWLAASRVETSAIPERPEQAMAEFRLGRHFLDQRVPDGVRRALSHFQRAAEIDPTFAEAHSGVAQAATALADMGLGDTREHYRQARASAETALGIDGRLAEAHAALGMVRLFADWDFRRADESVRRAIALDPRSVTAHRVYGMLLSITGRHPQAVVMARRAVSLDPATAARYNELAWALHYAGETPQALAEIDKALDIHPGFFPLYLSKAVLLDRAGQPGQAYTVMRQGYLRIEHGEQIAARLDEAYRRGGMAGVHEWWLEFALRGSPRAPQSDVWLARLFVRLGRNENALQALERAYQKREGALVWIYVEPAFDSLRYQPRFERLIEGVGFGPRTASRRTPS